MQIGKVCVGVLNIELNWTGRLCPTTRRIRALVHDRQDLAFALVNRSRPRNDGGKSQTVKPSGAMIAFLNLYAHHGLTISASRQRIELARAPVGAVTVKKFASFDGPFYV